MIINCLALDWFLLNTGDYYWWESHWNYLLLIIEAWLDRQTKRKKYFDLRNLICI